MSEPLFDVLAVEFKTKRVRRIAEDKRKADAEAIVAMAVMRRGVELEYFVTAPAGRYHDGDSYAL